MHLLTYGEQGSSIHFRIYRTTFFPSFFPSACVAGHCLSCDAATLVTATRCTSSQERAHPLRHPTLPFVSFFTFNGSKFQCLKYHLHRTTRRIHSLQARQKHLNSQFHYGAIATSCC